MNDFSGALAPFFGGLLTGLREGVEAALIVGIIAVYLVKIGRRDRLRSLWFGVGAAVLLSALVGISLYSSAGGLASGAEQVFEGLTKFAAAAVVTWMLFWMRKQAATLGAELRRGVDAALADAPRTGVALLAFTAVIREGVETALFLVGQAAAALRDGHAAQVGLGALIGLLAAAGIGVAIFRFGLRLNLARFFSVTGVALIVIAAGLLSGGVHEFIELGLLPALAAPAFDLSGILADDTGIGMFLRLIAGYRAAPELLTLLVHLGYLVVGLGLYLRPGRPAAPQAAPRATASLS